MRAYSLFVVTRPSSDSAPHTKGVAGSGPKPPSERSGGRTSGWRLQTKEHCESSALLFGTMCSACAERDAHFVRDVSFGSDVRFAREDAEHITSLCTAGAIHHCALALHHCDEVATSLFTNSPKCDIIYFGKVVAQCKKTA